MSTKMIREALVLMSKDTSPMAARMATEALTEVEAVEKALKDLREVAFDGPSEMKGTRCAESVSGWRQRINNETKWVKEQA